MCNPHQLIQDSARLDALYEYKILNTPPEGLFDDLARLAAQVCDMPMALINFIDCNRQWIKASIGWDMPQMPLSVGFCPHMIQQSETQLIVPDASVDPRFADNPLVTGEPHIRFYAGVALVSPANEAIGALCVMDRNTGTLTPKQVEMLSTLARQVVSHLESRRQLIDLTRQLSNYQQIELAPQSEETNLNVVLDNSLYAVLHIDRNQKIKALNQTASEWVKKFRGGELKPGDPIENFVKSEYLNEFKERFNAALNGELVRVKKSFTVSGDKEYWVEFEFIPIFDEHSSVTGVYHIGINVEKHQAAVDALARSEERFRSLVQNSSDIIAVLEADATISYISPSVEQILGYKTNDLIGKKIYAYVHPKDVPTCEAILAKILQHREEAVRSEVRLQHADGSWIFMEAVSNNQLDNSSVKGLVINSRNITKRKIAEAALREQENFIRLIADAVPVQISYVDAQQRYRFVNKQYEQMFGVAASAIIGKTVAESWGNLVYQSIKQYIDAALSGIQITYEHTVIRQGEQRYLTVTYIPHFGENEQVLGFFSLIQDITERKQTEAKIRASEERYRRLIQDLQVGVLLFGKKAEVVLCNQAALDLLGMSESELLGKNCCDPDWDVFHEDGSPFPGETRPVPVAIATRQAVKNVVIGVYNRTKGERVWLLVSAVPQIAINGSVSQVICTLSDITEWQIAKEDLRASEERFRELAQHLHQVFWMSSIDRKKIFYISPAYEQVYDASCQLMYQQPQSWINNIHPEEREYVQAAIKQQTLDPESRYDMEYRIVRRDGTIRWIWARAFPVRNQQGVIYRIAGIAEDITERKLAEQKIHASLQEKEILLKEIHHRVKNNLQVISSLLNLQAASINDPQALSSFKESQNRIKTIALIHEKLYQTQNLSQINFAGYVQELVINLFRAYGVNSSIISLKLNIENIFLPVDTAIPCALIINELVSNALKHAFSSEESGEIAISLQRDNHNLNNLILIVQDNGIGFPQHLDLCNPETLGLQLVTTLVKQIRGTIKLYCDSITEFEIKFTLNTI